MNTILAWLSCATVMLVLYAIEVESTYNASLAEKNVNVLLIEENLKLMQEMQKDLDAIKQDVVEMKEYNIK